MNEELELMINPMTDEVISQTKLYRGAPQFHSSATYFRRVSQQLG